MFRLNINVLPMFYQRQIKNVANYSFTTFYSYFQVVPPGIVINSQVSVYHYFSETAQE